ncbi:hypothetical protein [Nakamurella lactea]|uniref:hypothetical protein n=1 Tax=Nakamurella lactea TaxID=459515 RepID=UPI000418199C|nr:hypothetical protein [Nakamurella lactea]
MRRLAVALLAALIVIPVVLAVPAAAGVTGMTPQQAVNEGAAQAADAQGVTTYAAVVDRRTGTVVGKTDNADTQVASESLVKVLLAAYYLVKYNGDLPENISSDLHTMIVESDDALCSAYWTNAAVPAMAERFDLEGVALADDPGHWGATKVTAIGMAEFLYRMSKDKVVGPWLVATMTESHDHGSDGFDQNFGFNALDGAASKQGWGSDNDWHEQQNAVHSIGLTTNYAAAVLQTGSSGVYKSMRPLATVTAQLIADSTPPAVPTPTKIPPSTKTPTTTKSRTPTSPSSPSEQPGVGGSTSWWARAVEF